MATKRKTGGNKATNNPDFIVFHVEERGNGKSNQWNRIGAAWMHEDGNGLNVQLKAMPIRFDGKLTLRMPTDFDNDTGAGGQ